MTFREYTNSGSQSTNNKKTTFRDYTQGSTIKNEKEEELLQQIVNNSSNKTNTSTNNETIGGSVLGTGVQVGKGIVGWGEKALDSILAFGSSEWNPFMHWLYNGDIEQGQQTANELIQENAKQQVLDVLGYDTETQKQLDDMSYVKSDNMLGQLFEGIGEQLPSMLIGSSVTGVTSTMGTTGKALQTAQTAASLGTMAITASGAGIETALNNGATREEAIAYGILNAATEVGTELMFAGVGNVIGTGPVDDVIVNKLTKNMKDGLVKSLVKIGFSNLGEGIEETVSDVVQPFIQKLTYSDESLRKLFENQNFVEDFWMGVLSSTIMSGITGQYTHNRIHIENIENMTPEEIVGAVRKQEAEIEKIEIEDTQNDTQSNTQNDTQNDTQVTESPLVIGEEQQTDNVIENPLVVGEETGTTYTGKDINKTTAQTSIRDNTELYNKVKNDKQLVHLTNSLADILKDGKMDNETFSIAAQNKGQKYAGYGQQAIKFKPEILDYIDNTKLFKSDGAHDHAFAKESTKKFNSLEELINDNPKYYNELVAKSDIPILDFIEEVTIPKNSSQDLIDTLTEKGIKIKYYNAAPSYNAVKETTTKQTVTTQKGLPTNEELTNINNQNKNEFLKQLAKKGIQANEQTKVVTKGLMDNRKKMLETSAKNFAKQESNYRTDPKKLNTWVTGVMKTYDSYVADGGEIIPAFENLRKKYRLHTPQQATAEKTKTINEIPKIENKLETNKTTEANLKTLREATEKYQENVDKGMDKIDEFEQWFNEIKIHDSSANNMDNKLNKDLEIEVIEIEESAKKTNSESVTGNAVADEIIEIDDIEILDDILDDVIETLDIDDVEADVVVEKIMSQINSRYNEQGLREGKREALNKNKVMPNSAETMQKLVDQYYSLRYIDKQNNTTDIIDYMTQKNRVGSLINQAVNGSNFITVDYEVTNIPAIGDIFGRIPTNIRDVAYQQIVLEMDYHAKLQKDRYDIGNVDNRAAGYTTDEVKAMLDENYKTYPELRELIDKHIMPDIRKIVYNVNKQRIKYKTLEGFTYVKPEFAKNEMKLSDAQIKAATTKKGVKVDTADYFKAYNPYYIPISRETSGVTEGARTAESKVSKTKGLQEGAYQYKIQNLDDGMVEKLSMEYRKMLDNKVRTAIAKEWGNLTNEKIITYETSDGKLGEISTNSEGNVIMQYLDTNAKGELVNKTINITKEMADAYNGLGDSVNKFKETAIGKVLGYKSTLQRALSTKLNIPFQAANFFMDGLDAIINNEFDLGGNIDFVKNEVGGFIRDVKANTETVQEFLAFQGEHLTETITKGYVDKSTGIEAAKNKASKVLEVSELMTRYAVYKTARDNGYSIQEAQRMTREATTDFSKSGLLWKELDAKGFTVYVSAAVAGMNRAIDSTIVPITNSLSTISKQIKQGGIQQALNKESYSEVELKSLKKSTRQLVKLSLLGIGRELLKMLWDDEDKQKAIANLSDTEIRNNIIIPIGNDSVIKIPKGRVHRTLDAITDLFTDSSIRDEDKMTLGETLLYVVDSVGISSVDSATTFNNFISIIKNEDYYGNAIYKDNILSKESLDYVLKQYGNYIYKTVKYINGGTDINPWLSRFYTDTTTVSAYNNRFYNMKDAYSEIYDKSTGSFSSNDDMQNYFAYRVINYEKSSGELSIELAKLKALKADSTSTSEEIRKQEAKVQAIYQDIFSYIDNNQAVDYSIAQDGSVIKYGTQYRFTKNSEGSYVKDRK